MAVFHARIVCNEFSLEGGMDWDSQVQKELFDLRNALKEKEKEVKLLKSTLMKKEQEVRMQKKALYEERNRA